MNIGLLGGAFNPPHNGHIAIAQQVLDFTDCDEVWLVPAFRHTFQKPMVAVEDRVEMTKLLVVESKNTLAEKIRVCSLEVNNKLDGNTINLLPFLEKEHSYRFVIGSDNLPTFHLWGDWQQLLQQIHFLVFPRYGYPNEPLYENMTMINDESLIVSNISSTKIRERVRRGLSIAPFVPKGVEAYITAHGLYNEGILRSDDKKA